MLTKTKQWVGSLLGHPLEPIQRDFAESKAHLQEANADFRSRLAHFYKDREAERQAALEEDFQRVLDAWGMREEDIEHVINTLYIRIVVMFVPALIVSALIFWQSPTVLVAVIAGGALLVASLIGVFTTLWRISVLRHRHFYPFHQALTRLISKKLA